MRHSFVLVLLAGVVGSPSALAQQEKIPKPLTEDVVKVWRNAGASPGWMKSDGFGALQFRSGLKGEVGELPGFRLKTEKW